ncbi:hypothetical protein KP79_PYT04510 [Mizuhopecten yessoensis]|uniref:Uncharacterized protein n=1 Tax=Mizuhopecten yessoensis TaxID=6573 RepID=A0A210QIL7_MIZYE|nr:hypothetical protein KP79_PYT04510 [Mizuhopecten yessoensis]
MKDTETRARSAPVKSIGKLAKEAHGYETMEKFQRHDRLIFPGEKRRESTASVLVELTTPKQTRPKSASRRQFSNEDLEDYLDVQKKVTRDEMDDIVSRLSRPTYISSVRVTSANVRRVCIEEQNVKKKVTIQPAASRRQLDPNRFQGSRKVSRQRMDDMVSRLSQTSKRHAQPSIQERQEVNRKAGSLCSYRWMGIQNC